MKLKNRGAISNPEGRFEKETHEAFDDGWEKFVDEEDIPTLETLLIADNTKSIITTNDSPDIGFEQSINPYKGCEHGCIYCFARPQHAYLNMSPGLDFETKILYKLQAAQLFEKEISKPSYTCKPIVIGASTDPYQPAESQLKITRSLIEMLNKYNHPLTIITKGSLIERDIDILSNMAKRRLAKVAVSVTTLSTSLKQKLEPRTSTPSARLRVIQKLSDAKIPVTVMAAPMIPMINDKELEHILKEASQAGAKHAGYVLIRLPHEVKILFKEWLEKHFPERAEHVMSLIRQMRGGKEYDSTFGKRMKGEGEFAKLLETRFKIACKKFKLNREPSPPLDTAHFIKPVLTSRTATSQMSFDL
jgi:DNA repair photolyase